MVGLAQGLAIRKYNRIQRRQAVPLWVCLADVNAESMPPTGRTSASAPRPLPSCPSAALDGTYQAGPGEGTPRRGDTQEEGKAIALFYKRVI